MYSMGNISTSHHNRGRDEEKHAIRIKGRENRKKKKDHASMQHAKATNISYRGFLNLVFQKPGFSCFFVTQKLQKFVLWIFLVQPRRRKFLVQKGEICFISIERHIAKTLFLGYRVEQYIPVKKIMVLVNWENF